MVSSALPQHNDVNLTTTPRSAGSTLKPFLYLEAIDRKLATAATLLPDTEEAIREAYSDYDPRNYNDRFLGPVRLREALGNSLNVPAVVTLSRTGARESFWKLKSWGLNFHEGFDAYGAGFILGNAEVSLLDLAGAYASLARAGLAWHPILLAGEPAEPVRCGSPAAAAIITDILCDNDARRISFGNASPLNVSARVAVKTGTSSGFRDGWCIGFTGQHTIAVWTGNPDGSPMNAALAVRSAAPIWNAITKFLLARGDSPLPEIPETGELESCLVAKESGLLPRPGEPALREWFLPGTAPTEPASTMYRPVKGKETLILPSTYADWCASSQNRLGAVAETDGFAILFPKNGAVFSLNPALPAGQQMLVPQCSDPACEWFANGQKLASSKLRLRPGEYTLTAKSRGQERTASFRVE
jgi:penicillin-binding protein 1C